MPLNRAFIRGAPTAGFLLYSRQPVLTPGDAMIGKKKDKVSASTICKTCFSITKKCAASPRQHSTYCLPQWRKHHHYGVGGGGFEEDKSEDNIFPKAQNEKSSSFAAWTRTQAILLILRGQKRKGELSAKNLGSCPTCQNFSGATLSKTAPWGLALLYNA